MKHLVLLCCALANICSVTKGFSGDGESSSGGLSSSSSKSYSNRQVVADYNAWLNNSDAIFEKIDTWGSSVLQDRKPFIQARMQSVARDENLRSQIHPVCALIDALAQFGCIRACETIVNSYYKDQSILRNMLGFSWGTAPATGLNAMAYDRARAVAVYEIGSFDPGFTGLNQEGSSSGVVVSDSEPGSEESKVKNLRETLACLYAHSPQSIEGRSNPLGHVLLSDRKLSEEDLKAHILQEANIWKAALESSENTGHELGHSWVRYVIQEFLHRNPKFLAGLIAAVPQEFGKWMRETIYKSSDISQLKLIRDICSALPQEFWEAKLLSALSDSADPQQEKIEEVFFELLGKIGDAYSLRELSGAVIERSCYAQRVLQANGLSVKSLLEESLKQDDFGLARQYVLKVLSSNDKFNETVERLQSLGFEDPIGYAFDLEQGLNWSKTPFEVLKIVDAILGNASLFNYLEEKVGSGSAWLYAGTLLSEFSHNLTKYSASSYYATQILEIITQEKYDQAWDAVLDFVPDPDDLQEDAA